MRTISLEDAVAMISPGASLMIGGFMGVGTPEPIIDELVRQEKRDLIVIANDTAGAKRVIVAMQHSAKGRSKVVRECSLPLTSARPVDLLVTELAVIAFPDGRATLIETADGVSVDQVLGVTEAELVLPRELKGGGMRITKNFFNMCFF